MRELFVTINRTLFATIIILIALYCLDIKIIVHYRTGTLIGVSIFLFLGSCILTPDRK